MTSILIRYPPPLGNRVNDESENKVKDTIHNAISMGEVGQELYLLTKSLRFPLKYLRFSKNTDFTPKIQLSSLRILEDR